MYINMYTYIVVVFIYCMCTFNLAIFHPGVLRYSSMPVKPQASPGTKPTLPTKPPKS